VPTITFYTRRGCQLCDDAKRVVDRIARRTGTTVTTIDIDADPELQRRYNDDVPVIAIDGHDAFRHRVTEAELLSGLNERRSEAMTLSKESCVPCRGGVPPLPEAEAEELRRQLAEGWEIVAGHHLRRELSFPDFSGSLAFANRIGVLADEQGHHPDLLVSWGKLRIELWTHAIDGLTRSDFVLASKIDALTAAAP
jgi:4a-hydroxytetrahydrobiopterin dehydratase